MENSFNNDEWLYRAILPKAEFIKEDGTITSAAFKDKNGLSVDRGYYRSEKDVVKSIKERLHGDIAKVSVKMCNDVNAAVVYCPTDENEFHSEIHRDSKKLELSRSQARSLARQCIIVYQDIQ